jgi:histone-lysine N-methyltransferase SETMAR
VYFWINEVQRGRTDLHIIANPEREPGEGLTAAVAGKLEADPHISARKLAQSPGIADSTVCRYLTEVLVMKYRHLRWVPPTLTHAQRVMPTELAQSMLQALVKHKHMNYHSLFTCDESWIFCASDHRTRWVTFWDEVDEIERPLHFHQKTMFAIFVNDTGEYKIAILTEGQKVNGTYFIECAPRPLTKICYPQSSGTHAKRVMMHFDNAPIHRTEGIQESMANFEFRRMEYLPYSPDLAPCNFFLLDAMKQSFAWAGGKVAIVDSQLAAHSQTANKPDKIASGDQTMEIVSVTSSEGWPPRKGRNAEHNSLI